MEKYEKAFMAYRLSFSNEDLNSIGSEESRARAEAHYNLADLCKCPVKEKSHRTMARTYEILKN